MSMLAMQTVIAGLCVDPKFRDAFLADPVRALEPFDLRLEERNALRALNMNAVQEYAGSLLAKRMETIKKWFPLSFFILENELSSEGLYELFYQYELENISNSNQLGGDWVRDESHRFYTYFLRQGARRQINTPYFADILTFEMVKLSMLNDGEVRRSALSVTRTEPDHEVMFAEEFQKRGKPLLGQHVRLRSFRFNMAQVIPRIKDQQANIQFEEEPTFVLFSKEPHTTEISTSTINRPLKDLLELCDGARTVDQILSSSASRYAALDGMTETEAKSECLSMLVQLCKQGVVTIHQ